MRASAFPPVMPVLPVLLVLLGCAPPLADEPWRVTQRRVVAVLAEPPDAQPGSTVLLRAIIASPEGPVETAEVRWLRCDEQTPFSQNESTGLSCLAHLTTAPPGATTTQVTIPSSACSVFGPDVATASARPRDPDATGGYYQPIGVELDGQGSFAFERLRCNPANVTSQIAQDYRRASRPNTNPVFSLLPFVGGDPVDLSELPRRRGSAPRRLERLARGVFPRHRPFDPGPHHPRGALRRELARDARTARSIQELNRPRTLDTPVDSRRGHGLGRAARQPRRSSGRHSTRQVGALIRCRLFSDNETLRRRTHHQRLLLDGKSPFHRANCPCEASDPPRRCACT